MKVLSTEGLTKLIQLIKSAFISVDDTTQTTELSTKTVNELTLSTVATSGSYNDLTDKPDISGKEDTLNKVTSLSSSSTDTQYPSAKCVYNNLQGKIDTNYSNAIYTPCKTDLSNSTRAYVKDQSQAFSNYGGTTTSAYQFRVWSGGILEQCFLYPASTATSATVTLPKPYADTNYNIVVGDGGATATSTDTGGVDMATCVTNKTVSTFRVSKAKNRAFTVYCWGRGA